MYLKAQTLDDLLRQVFRKLLVSPITYPSRGPAREIAGILLKIDNPRARLSRTESKGKLFSAVGELLWYLAGTNGLSFIKYYVPRYAEESDDGETVYGGYGPRLFDMRGHDQVANVISTLKKSPDSRRAVIQLFDAADLTKRRKEIPCTCVLQFMVRDKRVHMLTYMRSNDAFFGLPHDVFTFTMLQEVVARTLGLEVGVYSHSVGSLHLYEEHQQQVKQYLKEGWQSTSVMPPMPKGSPWSSIRKVVEIEHLVRTKKNMNNAMLRGLDPYWRDFVQLLRIYRSSIDRQPAEVEKYHSSISSQIYGPYISDRHKVSLRPLKKKAVGEAAKKTARAKAK